MKITTARKHLPKSYRKLSDSQIEELLSQLEAFAEILLDVVDSGSKKQLGVPQGSWNRRKVTLFDCNIIE